MKEELAEGGKARTDKLCRGSRGETVTYKFVPTTRPSIFQVAICSQVAIILPFKDPFLQVFFLRRRGIFLTYEDQNTLWRPRSKNSYWAILDYRTWVGWGARPSYHPHFLFLGSSMYVYSPHLNLRSSKQDISLSKTPGPYKQAVSYKTIPQLSKLGWFLWQRGWESTCIISAFVHIVRSRIEGESQTSASATSLSMMFHSGQGRGEEAQGGTSAPLRIWFYQSNGFLVFPLDLISFLGFVQQIFIEQVVCSWRDDRHWW